MRGQMLWFNPTKDFGFISTDEGERLYVHGTGFSGGGRPEGRCAGRVVSFRVEEEDSTRQATEVVFVPEVSPRRARMRHGSRGRA
jgi:CspA family cold shock protein